MRESQSTHSTLKPVQSCWYSVCSHISKSKSHNSYITERVENSHTTYCPCDKFLLYSHSSKVHVSCGHLKSSVFFWNTVTFLKVTTTLLREWKNSCITYRPCDKFLLHCHSSKVHVSCSHLKSSVFFLEYSQFVWCQTSTSPVVHL